MISWLCLHWETGSPLQRNSRSAGTSLSAAELWMGSTFRRRHPPTQDPCSTTTREHSPLFSLRLWMQGIASELLMLGGTGEPATGYSGQLHLWSGSWAGTLHLPPDQPLPGGEHRGAQPHVFVADEAFPLRRELMRPFPGRLLPLERRIFNYRLSRARMIVEGAFGVLSSQWRMYRRPMELRPEIAEKCVKATCVLHNFLRCLDERGAPAVRSVAPAVVEPLHSLGRVAANNSSREAVLVREKFMAHFSAEGAVTWQPKE
uniref:DDE Tnp4 domain-containing protein n=1 Tax=Oreochromis aureus TaxID=47969 RepID=A0AAZ1Y682_OREAU